jgi:hypothetical protein
MFVLAACSKKEVAPPAGYLDLDYYPVKAGKFSVFEIDSVVYREIPRDTIHHRYQVREVFTESFTDDEGEQAWKLERYIRKFNPAVPYDSLPWVIKDIWQVTADSRKVQVVEENRRFTKLVFPVKENSSWNGNAANGLGEATYKCTYKDKNESLGQQNFEKVLEVRQKDYRTLISLETASEKYARGAGLVYRQYTELYSNNIAPQKPVEQRIEKGVVYTQTLIAHGYQ